MIDIDLNGLAGLGQNAGDARERMCKRFERTKECNCWPSGFAVGQTFVKGGERE